MAIHRLCQPILSSKACFRRLLISIFRAAHQPTTITGSTGSTAGAILTSRTPSPPFPPPSTPPRGAGPPPPAPLHSFRDARNLLRPLSTPPHPTPLSRTP